MLIVSNIKWFSPPHIKTDYVHPFYKDSIKYLFGMDVAGQCLAPTRNRKSMVEALNSVLGERQSEYAYFLDVRFQEDLGSPSPQYEILYDVGLTTVTPICIQGDHSNIIREGLAILDSIMEAGKRAVCSVSLLSSAQWQYSGSEFIIMFEVLSDGQPDGTIQMKGGESYVLC